MKLQEELIRNKILAGKSLRRGPTKPLPRLGTVKPFADYIH